MNCTTEKNRDKFKLHLKLKSQKNLFNDFSWFYICISQ